MEHPDPNVSPDPLVCPSIQSERTALGSTPASPHSRHSQPKPTRLNDKTKIPDSNATIVEKSVPSPKIPFSHTILDPSISHERNAFVKMIVMGVAVTSIAIFAFLSIYWGSIWKLPQYANKLEGIVVDFDQDVIGQAVITAFKQNTGQSTQLTWTIVDASKYNTPEGVIDAILAQEYWAAIVVNRGASANLQQAVTRQDANYNGSLAVNVYGCGARDDNAYSAFILPSIDTGMRNAQTAFASSHARSQADAAAVGALMRAAPQTITRPLRYVMNDLRPFDVPVAQAVVFVGLIYLLIISFILTLLNFNARMTSGLYSKLDFRSLIIVRVATSFFMFFWLSWVYALISLAFKVPFSRYYGRGGFLIYWAMSFLGMSALGLAVEALITILTPRFIPYFLVLWLITNISVSSYPIEMLPGVFRYGYATPFYNLSQTFRTIIFNTKDELGLNFGVQVAWIALSLTTLILFQFYNRRKEQINMRKSNPA
ncbi:uncharacterized protein MELLADRAFT_104233 [Melampsora larici-populina 98AG31]|uniref:DUF3533 domain-containing protein n=1 Tax=Melampsora larici-populina (strain 98AG31 / pathotype 3-4-7) TaxID=747676 RepID=F4RE13_MELLP|nr:uncharacterized protein MELLADRAFT_104233 [Melampsora larici-populina 98AG31]EGG09503.1 hypothetical protein MELLADRAFT_104233 [Melampsora larici-populina 98AG31]